METYLAGANTLRKGLALSRESKGQLTQMRKRPVRARDEHGST
eukprot:IDg13578t1